MLWKISQVQEPTKPKFYIRRCETSRQNIIVCSVIVRGHLRTQYFRSTQMPHETQAKTNGTRPTTNAMQKENSQISSSD